MQFRRVTWAVASGLWMWAALTTTARADFLELVSPDPPPQDGFRDRFGSTVAISGDTLMVGEPGEDYLSLNGGQGAVHFFQRQGMQWIPQAKLVPPGNLNAQFANGFGYDVKLSGNTAIVGTSQLSLKAFVYERNGNHWDLQATLTAPGQGAGSLFGNRVAISGNTAVVSSTYAGGNTPDYLGTAFVYERTGTTWNPVAALHAPDGTPFNYFGNALAVDGNTMAIGSQKGAYFSERSESGWSVPVKLTVDDGTPTDQLGASVAVFGDVMAVSSWNNQVYIFERHGGLWEQAAHLTTPDGQVGQYFGYTLSLGSETLLVSDHGENAAYLFNRSGDHWGFTKKYVGPPLSGFGADLALYGETAVAGNNVLGSGAEKVYVFQVPEPSGQMLTAGAILGIACMFIARRGAACVSASYSAAGGAGRTNGWPA